MRLLHRERHARAARRRSLRSFLPSFQALEGRALLTAVVADPSFETVNVGNSPSGFVYDPTGTPWSFTTPSRDGGSGVVDTTAGISGDGSLFTNNNPDAPDGAQVAFIQGYGTISQTINDWDAGTYQISLDAAQRGYGGGGGNFQDENFQVILDGTVITTLTPTDDTYQTYTTPVFEATAGVHTLILQGIDAAGGDNTAFLDDVQLDAVASPGVVVNDPGFEAFPLALGSEAYAPSGTPWTFSVPTDVSGAGVTSDASGFTYDNPDAPDGTQVAFLQQTGTISQTIADWPIGNYQVSFQAAQRGDDGSTQDFAVELDGSVIAQFTPEGTDYQTYTTPSFVVGAGPHTLSFVGLDSAGGDNTALIDDVGIESSDDTTDWTSTTTDADGDTTTESFTYTVNPDGTTTSETKLTDTYGDPSAAGKDVIGMDPATIPNGGINSLDITVTTSPISTVFTTTQDDDDSYSEGGTITDATSSGTWSFSGSDSNHDTSTTTDNSDGTSFTSSTTNDSSSDQYSVSLSGSSDTLANFSLTISGTDGATTNDNDAPGNDQDSQGSTATQTATLTATTIDGSNITADFNEAVSNAVSSSPSSTTTTTTDVGSQSYTDQDSGSMDGGISFSVNQANSSTFNNQEIVVNGPAGLISDKATDASTEQDNGTISVSGVDEGNGSGVLDSEVTTRSGNSTAIDTKQINPGSDVETTSSSSTQTNETQGTDAGGAFDSGGTLTSSASGQTANGNYTDGPGSSNNNPIASQGTAPTGTINMLMASIETLALQAPEADLNAALQQAAAANYPTESDNSDDSSLSPADITGHIKDLDEIYGLCLAEFVRDAQAKVNADSVRLAKDVAQLTALQGQINTLQGEQLYDLACAAGCSMQNQVAAAAVYQALAARLQPQIDALNNRWSDVKIDQLNADLALRRDRFSLIDAEAKLNDWRIRWVQIYKTAPQF